MIDFSTAWAVDVLGMTEGILVAPGPNRRFAARMPPVVQTEPKDATKGYSWFDAIDEMI